MITPQSQPQPHTSPVLVQTPPTIICSGLKLVAAPANNALLPRTGVRGFPHWGSWLQVCAGAGSSFASLPLLLMITQLSHGKASNIILMA